MSWDSNAYGPPSGDLSQPSFAGGVLPNRPYDLGSSDAGGNGGNGRIIGRVGDTSRNAGAFHPTFVPPQHNQTHSERKSYTGNPNPFVPAGRMTLSDVTSNSVMRAGGVRTSQETRRRKKKEYKGRKPVIVPGPAGQVNTKENNQSNSRQKQPQEQPIILDMTSEDSTVFSAMSGTQMTGLAVTVNPSNKGESPRSKKRRKNDSIEESWDHPLNTRVYSRMCISLDRCTVPLPNPLLRPPDVSEYLTSLRRSLGAGWSTVSDIREGSCDLTVGNLLGYIHSIQANTHCSWTIELRDESTSFLPSNPGGITCSLRESFFDKNIQKVKVGSLLLLKSCRISVGSPRPGDRCVGKDGVHRVLLVGARCVVAFVDVDQDKKRPLSEEEVKKLAELRTEDLMSGT